MKGGAFDEVDRIAAIALKISVDGAAGAETRQRGSIHKGITASYGSSEGSISGLNQGYGRNSIPKDTVLLVAVG